MFDLTRLHDIKDELVKIGCTFGHAGDVKKMHAYSTAAMHCELAVVVLAELLIGDDNETSGNAGNDSQNART